MGDRAKEFSEVRQQANGGQRDKQVPNCISLRRTENR